MRVVLVFSGIVVAVTGAGSAQSVHYEGGIAITSGDYFFTQRTTSWSIYNGLALSAGPLSFRVTLPVYLQDTKLLTVSSTGPLPTGGGPASGAVGDSAGRRVGGHDGMGQGMTGEGRHVDVPPEAVPGYQTAVGDPTVGMTLTLWRGSRTILSSGLAAKIPMTDTADFGTGTWDVGGSVSLSQALSRSLFLGLDVSYWHLGDLPDLDLRDPVIASSSLSYLTASGWGGSMSLSAGRSIVPGFDDTYTIGVGLTRLRRRLGLGVNASVGLTETAPDVTVAVNWRVGLSR